LHKLIFLHGVVAVKHKLHNVPRDDNFKLCGLQKITTLFSFV